MTTVPEPLAHDLMVSGNQPFSDILSGTLRHPHPYPGGKLSFVIFFSISHALSPQSPL